MFKKIKETTIESSKSAKNYTIKKWKKYIRKQALKKVETQLLYLQKKASDFSKDEMRELIAREEKNVISNLRGIVGMGTVLTLLGIPKL
tara:strand:+ start:1162 stop:1428 length:267 start_codon:yes stop_codon:yes gene_type:complete